MNQIGGKNKKLFFGGKLVTADAGGRWASIPGTSMRAEGINIIYLFTWLLLSFSGFPALLTRGVQEGKNGGGGDKRREIGCHLPLGEDDI